jgi:hypothetical protein
MVPAMVLERATLAAARGNFAPGDAAAVRQALATEEALVAELPADPDLRHLLAFGYGQASNILYSTGGKDPQAAREAIAHRRKALETIRTVIADRPGEPRFLKVETEMLMALGGQLADTGELREAGAVLADAAARVRARRAVDPGNADLAWDLVGVLGQTTLIGFRSGAPATALAPGREALALIASLPEATRRTRDGIGATATVQGYLGVSLIGAAPGAAKDPAKRRAMLVEARRHLQDVMRYFELARVEKMRVDESEVNEVIGAIALCDAEIPKLKAPGG